MDYHTEQLLVLLDVCIAEDDFYVLCSAMDSYWGRQLNPQVLQSILFRMCACGAENCLRLFLESKQLATVLNTPDRDGDRAIHKAARNAHANICWLLVTHKGVDVKLRNHNFDTALDIASRQGYLHLLPPLTTEIRLLEDRPTECQKYYLYTALTKASEAMQEDAIEELLKHGAKVNMNMDDEVGTPLHCAVTVGSERVVRQLLRHGADADSLRIAMNETPLMCAAEHGHAEVARILVEEGASIDLQTDRCSTALTVACHFGHLEVTEVLLAAGADPLIRNVWGFTALYMSTDSVPLLARLLKEPVDVNEQCGEREEVPLHLAAVIGSHEAGRMLLDAGADVDIETKFAETALWLAVWKGFADFVKLLLEHNCGLNAHSNGCQVYVWQYNSLEIAFGSERLDIAELLYSAGCSTENVYFSQETSNVQTQRNRTTRDGRENGEPDDRRGEESESSSTSSSISDVDRVTLPEVLKLRPEILDLVRVNDSMSTWACRRYGNCRSLMNACCITIRRSLPHSHAFTKAVETLPLPPALRDKIRYVWLSACS